MNAPANLELNFQNFHCAAAKEANEWRGRCIALFARGERAVSEHFLRDATRKLPMLLSQRLDQIAKDFEGHGRVSSAICGFRELLDLRNAVAHGDARYYVDPKGRRLIHFEYFSRRGIEQHTILQEHSEDLHRRIHQAVQRLAARLKANSRSSDPAGTPSA